MALVPTSAKWLDRWEIQDQSQNADNVIYMYHKQYQGNFTYPVFIGKNEQKICMWKPMPTYLAEVQLIMLI